MDLKQEKKSISMFAKPKNARKNAKVCTHKQILEKYATVCIRERIVVWYESKSGIKHFKILCMVRF